MFSFRQTTSVGTIFFLVAAIDIVALAMTSTHGNAAESGATSSFPPHAPIDSVEKHSRYHQELGLRHSGLGNLDRAIGEFSLAIKIQPAAALAFYRRGNAHFRKRAFKDAVRDYTIALDRHSTFVMAMTNRANAYSALGQPEAALEDYNAAISLEPDNAYSLFNRGYLHGKMRDFRAAIGDFSRVIELNPNDVNAYRLRAAAYMSIGNTEEATNDLAAAQRLERRQSKN